MLNFKKGVKFKKGGEIVKLHTLLAMMKVAYIYYKRGYTGVLNTVTSVMDGKHMEGSKHYTGDAFDQRTWADATGTQMDPTEKEDLAWEIREALGPDWDVVIERTHLHIEFDKKRGT